MKKPDECKTTARAFIKVAEEYYQAFKIINSKCPKRYAKVFPFPHVRYFLLCHSLELIFKAILLEKGYKWEVLKSKKIGHSLIKAATALKKEGVNIILYGHKKAIRQLDFHYWVNQKDFNYPKRTLITVPSIFTTQSIVQQTLATAKKIIGLEE